MKAVEWTKQIALFWIFSIDRRLLMNNLGNVLKETETRQYFLHFICSQLIDKIGVFLFSNLKWSSTEMTSRKNKQNKKNFWLKMFLILITESYGMGHQKNLFLITNKLTSIGSVINNVQSNL